jgi:hypothetical protein
MTRTQADGLERLEYWDGADEIQTAEELLESLAD